MVIGVLSVTFPCCALRKILCRGTARWLHNMQRTEGQNQGNFQEKVGSGPYYIRKNTFCEKSCSHPLKLVYVTIEVLCKKIGPFNQHLGGATTLSSLTLKSLCPRLGNHEICKKGGNLIFLICFHCRIWFNSRLPRLSFSTHSVYLLAQRVHN